MKSILVYCDNVSAVYLSTNPIQRQDRKHVEIDLHFADIFMKGLPTSLFSEFRSSLNIRSG
jgi:hypothetical protein